jgi:hypothetical protein
MFVLKLSGIQKKIFFKSNWEMTLQMMILSLILNFLTIMISCTFILFLFIAFLEFYIYIHIYNLNSKVEPKVFIMY